MDWMLESWLIERLGHNCVPKEEDFCNLMADGTLLAQLLHSYGIIDIEQKDSIERSEDQCTRFQNLNYLMPYLERIKLKTDENMLLKVTMEDQCNAVRLLYELYARLEPNSILHLEVVQKDKETSGKYSPRFTVSKVHSTEASSKAVTSVNPFIVPLKEKANVISWHREKYEQILNIRKENRRRIAERTLELSVEKGKGDCECCINIKQSKFEETLKDMDMFAQKCKDEEEKDIPISQLLVEQVKGENLSKEVNFDSEKIRGYVPYIKRKIKRKEIHQKIKKSIEKVLLSEVWEKLTREQESEFDSLITKKILKQSQYEKQILSKLHDIRDEKMRIVKNRNFIQSLIFKESEAEAVNQWIHDVTTSAETYRQQEQRKLIKLDYQRKLNEEKMRLKKEKCTHICADAISDMTDIAIKTSDFVTTNQTSVPQKMWDEWKVLFMNSQPIFDVLENIEEILEPEGNEDFEAKREIEMRRQKVLDEADFDAYLELKGPWLLEDLCPELGVLLEPQNVLGFIVYRILDSKYPTCPKMSVNLPPATVAVVLIGLDDEEILGMLQSLLEVHQVQILQPKHVIENFICAYQEELSKVDSVDANLIIATERTKAELTGRKFESPENKKEIRPVSGSSKASSTTADIEDTEKKDKKPKKGKQKGKGVKANIKEPIKIQLENKETQTEEEKAKLELTPKAYLGKMAFETLSIGEKISDMLMTKMLMEHIKDNELLGWVLINYPENYSQAKLMEEALVGISLPSEEEVIETIETLEEVKVREIEEKKPMRKIGCSRLVPNTFGTASCDFPKSYLTAYITLKKQTATEEESQVKREDVNQKSSISELKSVNVLDDTIKAKHPDSERVLQSVRTFVSFSDQKLSEEIEKSEAIFSRKSIDTKASKLYDDNLRKTKGDTVRWKDDSQQRADKFGELEEELGSENVANEEIGKETNEGNIIGQEVHGAEALGPLDKFYLNQEISFVFYYEDFDLDTLKNLARLIIGNSDITKDSVELFGPLLEELQEYLTKKSEGKTKSWNAKKILASQSLAKAEGNKEENVVKSVSTADKGGSVSESKGTDGSPKKEKKKRKKGKKEMKKNLDARSYDMNEQTTDRTYEGEEIQQPQTEPGPEKEVAQYMNFEIAQELLRTLATIWENLEEVYTKDFKEAFFMKRIYHAATFPYATFVKSSVSKLINRTDNKQIFVYDFQKQFNEIVEDLRSDMEVKSELYMRVYELRMALYDIADSHKFEVEAERKRIIRTNWVTEHLAAFTNIYLLAIQLEADRFVDTLQILNDYYMGMLDKLPTDDTLQKIMVTRIELATPTTSPPKSESEESLTEQLELASEEDTRVVVNGILSEKQMNDKKRIKVKDKNADANATVPFPTLIKSASSELESPSTLKVSSVTKRTSNGQPTERSTNNLTAKMKSLSLNVEEIPRKIISKVTNAQPINKDSAIQESSANAAKTFIENMLIDAEMDSTLHSPFHSVISDTLEDVSPVINTYIRKQLEVLAREEAELIKKDKKGNKWKDRDTSPEAELKKIKMIQLRPMSEKFFEEWKTVLNSEAERVKARLQLILKRAFQDLDDLIQWAKSLFHGLHKEIATRYKGEIVAVDELCKVLCKAIEDERRIQEELVLNGDEFFTRPHVLMFPRPSPEKPPPVEEPFLNNSFRVEQLRRLLKIFRIVAPTGLMPERALCYILEDLIMCRSEGHELPPLWYRLTSPEVPVLLEAIYGKVEYVEWREFIIRALDLSYPTMKQVLWMREEFEKHDISLKGNISIDAYTQITLWFEKNVPEDEVTLLHIRLAKELLLSMFQTSDSQFGYMTFLLNFCKDEDPKRGLAKAFALMLRKPLIATESEYKLYQKVIQDEERKREQELKEATALAKEVIWTVSDDAVQSVSGIIIKEIIETIEEEVVVTEEQKEVIKEVIENIEQRGAESEEQQQENCNTKDSVEVLFKNSSSSNSTGEEELQDLHNARVAIPVEVIVNVLTASLPWHGKTENVLDAGEKSLLVKLDQVCDELGDGDNCVIAHEFLSHKFICDLLDTTYKFHSFRLQDKVERVFMCNELLDPLCDQIPDLAT